MEISLRDRGDIVSNEYLKNMKSLEHSEYTQVIIQDKPLLCPMMLLMPMPEANN